MQELRATAWWQTPFRVQPPRARLRIATRCQGAPRAGPASQRRSPRISRRPRPAAPSHAAMSGNDKAKNGNAQRSPPRATGRRGRGLFPPAGMGIPGRDTEGRSSSGPRVRRPKTHLRLSGSLWRGVAPNRYAVPLKNYETVKTGALIRGPRETCPTPPKWARKASRRAAGPLGSEGERGHPGD